MKLWYSELNGKFVTLTVICLLLPLFHYIISTLSLSLSLSHPHTRRLCLAFMFGTDRDGYGKCRMYIKSPEKYLNKLKEKWLWSVFYRTCAWRLSWSHPLVMLACNIQHDQQNALYFVLLYIDDQFFSDTMNSIILIQ